MDTNKQVVEDALHQALEELDRRAPELDLSKEERLALAWMLIQYSGYVCTSKEVPILVEEVIRHPDRYSSYTVKGLMLSSPIARELLFAYTNYSPSRMQQRRIQKLYRALVSSQLSR